MGMIAAVTYFLLVEHRQHVFEFLPFLILLLCPLMHVFMHAGHGRHKGQSHEDSPTVQDKASPSFHANAEKNDAYRAGFIAGLKVGRDKKSARRGQDGK